jgi:hypothetical protein
MFRADDGGFPEVTANGIFSFVFRYNFLPSKSFAALGKLEKGILLGSGFMAIK